MTRPATHILPAVRRASYRRIEGPYGLLAQGIAFDGNSMHAVHERDHYVVYSYSTEIARRSHYTEAVVLNDRKYSPTTSRHQNLCRTWL